MTFKTYVFDLDGTLCSHEKDYNDAIPMPGRIAEVNKLFEQGHHIIIDTARGATTGIDWFHITEKQLALWGLKYHSLRVGKKLFYDVIVDDKAINDNHFFHDGL